MDFEKMPLKSKKFLAFFFVVILLFALGMTGILTGVVSVGWAAVPIFLAIILTIGFLGVGYILGQASLDKYTRLAKITQMIGGKDESDKPTEE